MWPFLVLFLLWLLGSHAYTLCWRAQLLAYVAQQRILSIQINVMVEVGENSISPESQQITTCE